MPAQLRHLDWSAALAAFEHGGPHLRERHHELIHAHVLPIVTHVDLDLSFSITKRTFPPPDPNAIDQMDYEQLSRLSYAEPLSLTGSIGLTFHLDPTNGVRNDRIESI